MAQHRFYVSNAWQKLRARVLMADHYECQHCRAAGRYTPAVAVHHVNHVTDRPDLALSETDDSGGRNLVSLCDACHRLLHIAEAAAKHPEHVTPERW
jgi:5-methylcytosine-specific restriction endonuclease McrA